LLAAFLWGKVKSKFYLSSLKSLTKNKNPSSNPLQRACCDIQKAAYGPKNCSESQGGFPKAAYEEKIYQ
jgi:hypothetical protein